MALKKVDGFTIIELVAVVLLVGILASLTVGRLTDSALFDARIAADVIIAELRAVQQLSMGRSLVSIRIGTDGAAITISQLVSGAATSTRSFPTNEVAITAGSVGSGTSCGSISSTIILNFDSAGEIETVDDDGFPICLNGESSLCISPAGFAHQGECL